MSYKQEIYVALAQGDQCGSDTGQREIKKLSRMVVWTYMRPRCLGASGHLLGAGGLCGDCGVTVGSLALSLEPLPRLGRLQSSCVPSLLGKGCPKAEETPGLGQPADRATLAQVAEATGDAVSFLSGWRMCDPVVGKSLWQNMRLTNWSWEKTVPFTLYKTTCHL